MKITTRFFLLLALLTGTRQAYAHCEIPCGIYTDSLRIVSIQEDIRTIEKSMQQIIALSSETPASYNQLVRWVNNKELHANKIQEVVAQYFLHQRVKLPKTNAQKEVYMKQLGLLHELLVYAMKAKQTTDVLYVEKMNTTLSKFSDIYFHKH